MPICPHCSLGIPPSFVVCPDCGRRLVEIATTTTFDDHIEIVEIHGLSDMFVDALPGEVSPEPPELLPDVKEPEPEAPVGQEECVVEEPAPTPKLMGKPRPARAKRTSQRPPRKTRTADRRPVAVKDPVPDASPRPKPSAQAQEARPTSVKRPKTPRVGKPRGTPTVAEGAQVVSAPKSPDERKAAKVRRARTRPSWRRKPRPPKEKKEKKERVKASRPVAQQEEQPVPLSAIEERSRGFVEVSDHIEAVALDEALELSLQEPDLDDDHFVGTAKGFARIKSHPGLEVPLHGDPGTGKTVRWAHRAYRGEVEVHATTGGASCTLVVFGDGFVLIGVAGGLVPALTGRGARKQLKILSLAGSSAQAHAAIPGSKRLAAADIESVHIEKGRTLQRELKIRTASGEQFGYRFPSKRHRQVISLLAPVLGGKLRDGLKPGKTAPRS
jgi:hypothetical protein